LLIPNGAWRADTVITDTAGREYFVLLEMDVSMRTYEAVFADLDGRPLVCIKRHVTREPWKDGYYFCTYRPNYRKQKSLSDRDVEDRKVYPHSYLEISPMKGRFHYQFLDDQRQMGRVRLSAHNPWMGFMMGCCTCVMRCGRFTASFKKKNKKTQIAVDQWRNTVKVAPNNDLLAALCIAYVFDKCQNQPMVTMIGGEEDNYSVPLTEKPVEEDDSSGSEGGSDDEEEDDEKKEVEMQTMDQKRKEAEKLEHLNHQPPLYDDASVASQQRYLPGPMYGGAPPPRGDAGSVYSAQSQRSRQTQQSQQSGPLLALPAPPNAGRSIV